MSSWQPIETAPTDEWIIVYIEWVGKVRQARLNTTQRGTKGWKVCYAAEAATSVYATPSHWMPLPKPPCAGEPDAHG